MQFYYVFQHNCCILQKNNTNMNCIICNKEIFKPKRKYCSNSCKGAAHYARHREANPNTTYSQYKRADVRKKHLIHTKGGCCAVCGYNKNYAALSFHHRCCKNFSLDSRNIGNRSFSSVLAEVQNCDLLCLNCHSELHNPELLL